eukprot:PhM_4_TR13334/c1_g3_i4/m.17479
MCLQHSGCSGTSTPSTSSCTDFFASLQCSDDLPVAMCNATPPPSTTAVPLSPTTQNKKPLSSTSCVDYDDGEGKGMSSRTWCTLALVVGVTSAALSIVVFAVWWRCVVLQHSRVVIAAPAPGDRIEELRALGTNTKNNGNNDIPTTTTLSRQTSGATFSSYERIVNVRMNEALSSNNSEEFAVCGSIGGTQSGDTTLALSPAMDWADERWTVLQALCQTTVLDPTPWVIGPILSRSAAAQLHTATRRCRFRTEVAVVKRLDLLRVPCPDELSSIVKFLTHLSHPCIVPHREIRMDVRNATLDMFTDAAPGGSIGAMARASAAQLPENLVAACIRDVLDALLHLHSIDVVHRDVKGDNIVLSGKGTAQLCDLTTILLPGGASPRPAPKGTSTQPPLVGSAHWLAPEVVTKVLYTSSGDVWAVGCTVAELLNHGVPPWGPAGPNVWILFFGLHLLLHIRCFGGYPNFS